MTTQTETPTRRPLLLRVVTWAAWAVGGTIAATVGAAVGVIGMLYAAAYL